MLDEDDNVREGFLEHEQYVALRDELPDHQKLILVIGYHLGMRRGEILKLGPSRLGREPDPAGEETNESEKGPQCAALRRTAGLVRTSLFRTRYEMSVHCFLERTRHHRSEDGVEEGAGTRVSLHCWFTIYGARPSAT